MFSFFRSLWFSFSRLCCFLTERPASGSSMARIQDRQESQDALSQGTRLHDWKEETGWTGRRDESDSSNDLVWQGLGLGHVNQNVQVSSFIFLQYLLRSDILSERKSAFRAKLSPHVTLFDTLILDFFGLNSTRKFKENDYRERDSWGVSRVNGVQRLACHLSSFLPRHRPIFETDFLLLPPRSMNINLWRVSIKG